MKKDDMIVFALAGGAALLVAKAAGLSLPSLSSLMVPQTFQQSINRPLSPFAGTSYDPVDPGEYIWNNSLIAGSIHDFYSGDVSSYGTPTVQELFDSVVYDGKPRSVIRVDGQYW